MEKTNKDSMEEMKKRNKEWQTRMGKSHPGTVIGGIGIIIIPIIWSGIYLLQFNESYS